MRRREFLYSSAVAGSMLLGCGGATPNPQSFSARSIRVVDLLPEFFAYWERAKHEPIETARERFLAEIVAAHREIYAPNVIGYAPDVPGALAARIDGWLPIVREQIEPMREIHRAFTRGLDESRARLLDALPDFDWPGPVYLIASVDAFNGAGRRVGDDVALLFGLDVIARMQANANLAVLFHHELFHMYQVPAADTVGEAMWVEGLATYASIALNPGTSDADALPMSHRHDPADPQHSAPERAVSLADAMPSLVRDVGPLLRARLRATESQGDPEAYAMFFLGRAAPGIAGYPVRSGYWFGLQLVRRIARGRSLRELAAIEPASLLPEIERELDALIAAA